MSRNSGSILRNPERDSRINVSTKPPHCSKVVRINYHPKHRSRSDTSYWKPFLSETIESVSILPRMWSNSQVYRDNAGSNDTSARWDLTASTDTRVPALVQTWLSTCQLSTLRGHEGDRNGKNEPIRSAAHRCGTAIFGKTKKLESSSVTSMVQHRQGNWNLGLLRSCCYELNI